jgi:hypothetical protein
MRLAGLRLNRKNLYRPGVLHHRAADAEPRNRCRMEAVSAHLVMAITGMRRRANRRKQERGKDRPEEEARSPHYPMIRHEIMPALYRRNCECP